MTRNNPKMSNIKIFHHKVSYEDLYKDYGIMFTLIKYFGLLNFKPRKMHEYLITLIFPVLFHLGFVDHFLTGLMHIGEEWVIQWKIELIYTLSLAMRLLVWHKLRRASQAVIHCTEKIKNLPAKPLNIAYLNTLVFAVVVVLLVHAVSLTCIAHYLTSGAWFEYQLYGVKFEQIWIRNLCFFLKCLFYPFLPAMIMTTALGLHMILCQRLSNVIGELSKTIEAEPGDIVSSNSTRFFSKFFRILEAVKSLQDAFSSTLFCLCVTYLMMNFCMLSSFILYPALDVLACFDYAYRISFFMVSLYLLYHFSDYVPTQMGNLRSSVYGVYGKLATRGMSGDDRVNFLYVEQIVSVPDCVLSGGGVLYFTKNNFLAVFGSLVTYGVILVQLNRQGNDSASVTEDSSLTTTIATALD